MQRNLTNLQVNALLLAIASYYTDLREEINHSDDDDMRQSWTDGARALELIRDQLEPGWLARNGAGADDATAPTPPT